MALASAGVLHPGHYQARKSFHHRVAAPERRMEGDLLQPLALELPQLRRQFGRLADNAKIANDLGRDEARLLGVYGGVVARVHGEM